MFLAWWDNALISLVNNVCFASYLQDYDADDIEECKQILLKECDLNRDGRIDKDELSMVLISFARVSRLEELATQTVEAAQASKWKVSGVSR